MSRSKFSQKAAILLGAICLGTAALAPQAQAQYTDSCPYGYYYVAGYGCAPLSYYSEPDILPFGFYGWGYRGWGYRGWHGNYGYRGAPFHGAPFHGAPFHGGPGHRR